MARLSLGNCKVAYTRDDLKRIMEYHVKNGRFVDGITRIREITGKLDLAFCRELKEEIEGGD